MVMNPPDGYQRIIPYLYYRDAAAGLAYVCRVFGFESKFALKGPDGKVGHAEASYEGNVVMLGTPADVKAPEAYPARHSSVLCYVDDVDAHHARAVEAGAAIEAPLEDKPYGDRMYAARDPEGHLWFFSTHVKDVQL